LPHLASFTVIIIKAMDVNFARYYKREVISKSISLELMEKNMEKLFKKVLLDYYSWTEDMVKNSERTKIDR
jgi:cell division protein FtsL